MKQLFFVLLLIISGINLSFSQPVSTSGSAIKLDGVDDYIVMPNYSFGLTGASTFTFETWVYYSTGGGGEIFTKPHSGGGTVQYALFIDGGNNTINLSMDNFSNGGWQNGIVSSYIEPNKWNHVALVKGASLVTLYINGNSVAGGEVDYTRYNAGPSDAPVKFGGYVYVGANSNVIMDEIKLWNRTLQTLEINQYMYRKRNGNEDALAAYYSFDNGSGSTVEDISLNNSDATLYNNPTWIESGALEGSRKAIELNDNSEYIALSPYSPFQYSGSSTLTFETWIYYYGNQDATILGKYNSGWHTTQYVFGIQQSSGRLFFHMDDFVNAGWQGVVASNNSIPTNEWVHVALVKTATTASIYINGVLDNSGNIDVQRQSSSASTGLTAIGNSPYFQNFDGKVDEIRFWNTARTETQIRENMMITFNEPQTGLVAYYSLNESTGIDIYNRVSTTYNATLYSSNNVAARNHSGAFNRWIGAINNYSDNILNWSDGLPSSNQNVNFTNKTDSYSPIIQGNPTYNNVIIGENTDLELNSNSTFNGNVFLNDSVNLVSYTLTLGSKAYIYENPGYFYGNGLLSTTRSLNNISALNIAGLGAVLTTTQNMGSTLIQRGNYSSDFNQRSINRFYNINPTNNAGLNATLTFNYYETELNSNTEADLELYRSTDNGNTWINNGGTVNTSNNYVTLSGIDGFSRWTLSSNNIENKTIYVSEQADGSNNGSSWSNAFNILQDGLDIAGDGDQIWVAKGTYKPTYDYETGDGINQRYNHFRLIEGVSIYGGFAGTENSVSQRVKFGYGEINETILSGDIGVQGDETDNTCSVIIATSLNTQPSPDNPNLDGFSITGGYADDISISLSGGAILNLSSSPLFKNITLYNNYSNEYGGAIYNVNSSPIYLNLKAFNNSSYEGGAIASFLSEDIYENVLLFSNSSIYNSGAVRLENSDVLFNNATIVNNSTEGIGGGAGVFNSIVHIYNSIIRDNTSDMNTGNESYLSGSNITISYTNLNTNVNDIYNDLSTVNTLGLIDLNPKFLNIANGDYRLLYTSPCIDAGLNLYVNQDFDIRNFDRIQNTTVDMGAYEYTENYDSHTSYDVASMSLAGLRNGNIWDDENTFNTDPSTPNNGNTPTDIPTDPNFNGFRTWQFNGTNQSFQIPYNSQIGRLNNNSPKTLFVHFRTTNSNRRQVLIELGGTNSGINAYIFNGKLWVGVWNSSQRRFFSKTITDNTNYVLSVEYNGQKVRTSLNGNCSSSMLFSGFASNSNLNGIGASTNGTRYMDLTSGTGLSSFLGGTIAEILLYNSCDMTLRSEALNYFDYNYGYEFFNNYTPYFGKIAAESNWDEYNMEIDPFAKEGNESNIMEVYQSSNEISINLAIDDNYKIDLGIFDLTGNLIDIIYSGDLKKGENNFKYSINKLISGTYIISAIGAEINTSYKVSIVK